MAVKISDQQSVPSASTRLISVIIIGLVAGLITGILGSWDFAPLVSWDVAAISYMVWVWTRILKFDAALVKHHALREDPSRPVADVILIIAAVASLAGVGTLLVATKDVSGAAQIGVTALAVGSVIMSWFMVHTIFALKYAELYYSKPEGGVDFGEKADPTYVDFAYLAATLGMTFQVSDTTLGSRRFRSVALRHALLSYLLGTVIIAATVNLIASLGH